MAKTKGRRQRDLRYDRVKFLMSLHPQQHQQLKRIASDKQQSMALVIENYLNYMLLGEIAQLDRRQEQQGIALAVTADFDAEFYQQTYSEVEFLVGEAWLKMRKKRRRALAFLALFPYEPTWRLARMCSLSRQGLQKIKQSPLGVKVVNHFSDRSLWSRRPELLRSVIDKAIESDEPAWSELAMRIFGDYSLKVEKQETRLNIDINNNVHKPADLDRELIEQAKLLNMTPARFTLLWELEEGKAELTALP